MHLHTVELFSVLTLYSTLVIHTQVLVFVYWLASATSYRIVSETFDMPRSTICDVVHRVSRGIQGIIRRVIRYPTQAELEEVGAGFAHLARSHAFRSVAGAIDGMHVRFIPPAADQQSYFNRKLYYSIQMQAVCDHKGWFVNIFVGFPGSVHDSRVLKNSDMFVHRQYPPEGWFLLGDGGYPCMDEPFALVTPFRYFYRKAFFFIFLLVTVTLVLVFIIMCVLFYIDL